MRGSQNNANPVFANKKNYKSYIKHKNSVFKKYRYCGWLIIYSCYQ